MSDLISRQDVLELAKDVTLKNGCKHRCIDATQIYELPSAQQWIPCSEVLPSENGYYLVTYRWIGTYSCEAYLEIGIDEWRKGEWVEKPTAWEVLAWMPLPEPYTEVNNGN